MGLFDMRGAYTRSSTSVKEKVSLSAGSLYAGGLYVEKYGRCSAPINCFHHNPQEIDKAWFDWVPRLGN